MKYEPLTYKLLISGFIYVISELEFDFKLQEGHNEPDLQMGLYSQPLDLKADALTVRPSLCVGRGLNYIGRNQL